MGNIWSSSEQITIQEARSRVFNEFKNYTQSDCSAKTGDLDFVAEGGAKISDVTFNQSCSASLDAVVDTMIEQLVGQEITSELSNVQGGGFFSKTRQVGHVIQEEDVRNYIENNFNVSSEAELGSISFRASGTSNNGTPSVIENISIEQVVSAENQPVVRALADSILTLRGDLKALQKQEGGLMASLLPLLLLGGVAVIFILIARYFIGSFTDPKFLLTAFVILVVGATVYFVFFADGNGNNGEEGFMDIHHTKNLVPYGVRQDRDNSNTITDNINEDIQTYLFYDKSLGSKKQTNNFN